jgi:hypothetical protein
MIEPTTYQSWIELFQSRNALFCLNLREAATGGRLRVFLRHDIDLLDSPLLEACLLLERSLSVRSTWFFLPPRDIRYGNRTEDLKTIVRLLHHAGHQIGYHVNVWEKPGTKNLGDEPLKQLDYDLKWFADVIGEPIGIAAAHGIPHLKDRVSNLSMFDALAARGVFQFDPFIVHDGGTGAPIPHFGHRSMNPLLPEASAIVYISDSGGPIRKVWNVVDDAFIPGALVVFNTHCGNYDVRRTLTYETRPLRDPSMLEQCDRRILI